MDGPFSLHIHYEMKSPRISQLPSVSVSTRAVPLDPAGTFTRLANNGEQIMAFQIFDFVGFQIFFTRLNSFTLSHYGPSVALPTLNSCRYLHQSKAQFSVERLTPF